MGRRKIEIKAIKDDRNRSVTFLKRKGGLFKKAHELSVLCSVDVAVIIFGHNKKLYEYSSGDINETIGRHQYYGGAHEHKGPADFAGKGDDRSDDEDVDEAAIEEQMGPDQHLPPHMQNQPGFSHMRHAPSASPPVGNGAMPYPHRRHTPQPTGMGSRPSSRNAQHIQRPNSNLGHPQAGHGPPMANGYSFMPAPSAYGSSQQHGIPISHPGQQPAPHPQFQYSQQQQQQQQSQHSMPSSYMQQERRQGSMPPQYPQNERQHSHPPPSQQHQPQSQPHQQQQQPQQQQQQQQHPPPPQPPQIQTHPPQPRHTPSPPHHQESDSQQNHPHPPPQQPKPLSVKNSKSIFTPIDDNRSLLAGGWDFGPSTRAEPPRSDHLIKQEMIKQEKDNRSQSVDVGSMNRSLNHSGLPVDPPPQRAFTQPQRTQSTTSLGAGGDKGRPRLKVQIPSEHSEDETDGPPTKHGAASTTAGTATSGTSPKPSTSSQTQDNTPAKTEPPSGSGSGVVLPPPSPSQSALLSAGATGPPNPFARPFPPSGPSGGNSGASGGPGGGGGGAGGGGGGSNSNMDTPISALPSRFVADQFLPSPSSFYPEWGFGSGGRSAGDGSNMLPSPLNFQTPVQGTGPGFGGGLSGGGIGGGGPLDLGGGGHGDGDRKRKSPEGDGGDGHGGAGGGVQQAEAKRVKA